MSKILAISMISMIITPGYIDNKAYGASEEEIGNSSELKDSEKLEGTQTEVGNFIVKGGGRGKDFEFDEANWVLTILSDTKMTIKMTEPGMVTTGRIEIKKDVSANITLSGVNIDTHGRFIKTE